MEVGVLRREVVEVLLQEDCYEVHRKDHQGVQEDLLLGSHDHLLVTRSI